MKKKLLLASSIFMLMSLMLVSGCSQTSKTSGSDWHSEDLYKMIPKAKHEKRFPRGHEKKDENKRCYYEEGTPAYFCQYWDDWDE